jgi:outer membrane protein OmpA-like peptidoglycan-associated protein
MQALINYLHLSPDTRARIEGFTDNVGGADYNR